MSTTASAPADKASAIAGQGVAAPEILWAQRSSDDEPEKNVVMVTINVPNLPPAPATKLDLHEDGFKFSAKVGDQAKGIAERSYAFDLTLFDKIDVENSKVSQSSKSMYLLLRKKEAKLDYWPRLSKEKIRLHNVKTDFDKWVDEDEQSGNLDDFGGMGDGGMGGMDPSMAGMGGGMGGMGGMGGAGGMDLQAMLQQMQAGGGAGGMGGMPDFSAMAGGPGEEDEDSDDDEEDAEGGAAAAPAEEPAAAKISEETSAAPAKDVENVD